MNKTQKDFINLLKNAVKPDKVPVDNINYSEMEMIANNHLCLPLIYDGAARASQPLPESWKQYSLWAVGNNYKNLNVQSKIVSILKNNNINCAILKGITVSRCYPEPLYRPLGDIDILVETDKYDTAINILTGTTQRDYEHLKHKFHYQFLYEGVSIEIHKAITEYTEDEYGYKLKKYLGKALDNTKIERYDCFSFPMLSDEFQIISLALHTQRHFIEHKASMRMVCDFAVAARSINNDIWNNKVYPALCELGLETFSSAIMGLSSKYFGVNFDDKTKKYIDEEIIDALISEFLCDGISPSYNNPQNQNFKETLINVLITIQQIVKRDFKIVEKIPVLFPVFYIYVPLRSLIRKLSGKRNNITIAGYGASYNRRNSLCKKLKL